MFCNQRDQIKDMSKVVRSPSKLPDITLRYCSIAAIGDKTIEGNSSDKRAEGDN